MALETASDSAVYDWRLEEGPTPFKRETVFPGEVYDEISPRRMHRAVTAALDRLDPDAVHIHSYSTPDARACLAWCRRRRRIAICMAESKASDAVRVRWRESLKQIIVSEFDAAQAAGSAAARYHVHLGIPEHRIFAGYSVVDNDYFSTRADAVREDPGPARALPGLSDSTPYFFSSARFMERKDLPGLLHSFAAYRRRAEAAGLSPWRLLLLGDGPLRPDLESIVGAEGLTDCVDMPGWRQLEDLPAYYALAAAFVHTAEVDQWGLVVNEAMASGLPVIVSTGAGCAEDLVCEGENGFKFTPGDRNTLAEHMYTLAHVADCDAFAQRSREIIAEWPLRRFGTSLLKAVYAGAEIASQHGFNPLARAAIGLLRLLARSPRSFHAVQD